MKILPTIVFMILSLTLFSQTQLEMNEQAFESYKKADEELNTIYQKIIVEYKEDTAFLNNLKISQRLWIKFRDAELKTRYPDQEPGYYGSFHPVCVANFLEKMTKDRSKALKLWLDGIKEGNMCNGSVKVK